MKKVAALLVIPFLFMSRYEAAEPVETVKPVVIMAEPVVDEVTEQPVEELAEIEVEPELVSLGEFKLTAYCSCKKCCGKWAECRPLDEDGNEIVIGASGEVLTAGHSIAVDPKLIPYGTTVVINGKEYVAQDCGGSIKNNRIDVYFNDHAEALEFGVQYAEVFIQEVHYSETINY